MALVNLPDLNLNGLIAPGHLSVITGTGIYRKIVDEYGIGVVVTGFESLDILTSIRMLLEMVRDKKPEVKNEYSRAVKESGKLKKAMKMMNGFLSRWIQIGGESESSGEAALPFLMSLPLLMLQRPLTSIFRRLAILQDVYAGRF